MTFVIVENVTKLLNINERATILACEDILRPDHSVWKRVQCCLKIVLPVNKPKQRFNWYSAAAA
jgi:hypothetical protein